MHEVFNGGGNPYGASYTSDHHVDGQLSAEALMVARAQGARLARVTSVIAAKRVAGLLTANAPAENMIKRMHAMNSDVGRAISGEDVAQLAEALRAAKRSHMQSSAELRQADVEPAEDWATWYAEFLLGVR